VSARPALQEFGRRVAAARVRAGRSQEALAELAGLHRTYISLLERGKREPSLDTLVALSRALDVTPVEALSWYPVTGDEAMEARAVRRGERRGR
jgi:transcriptional regulator with XRE-family HTH domain